MDDEGDIDATVNSNAKMKFSDNEDETDSDEEWDSEEEDETIARVKRAHYAEAAAMSRKRRPTAKRPPRMSHKRKMEAVKSFHDFTKKLKKDTGITIRSLTGNNILEMDDLSSSEGDQTSDSDGLSEEEFVVNPKAVEELNQEDESYIDPETGDLVEPKKSSPETALKSPECTETPKTLTINDLIDEDLDLIKNVEIAEIEGSELCLDKNSENNLDKQEESSQDYDITEKLKEMGEISVKPVKKEDPDATSSDTENKKEEEEKKPINTNALNVRRNIREVMDEKQLDASTLAAQRQESERLARVQEQQRIIREVQRQIALNRQNKVHQKTLALLQGGSSILKKAAPGHKLNLPNTVLVKLPSGETKKTTVKHGQVEVTRVSKPAVPGSSISQKLLKPELKTEKKEVVEIVDSSSGEETSSSSSESDDCIMLSDSEVPHSPEAEDDPNNSGLHVNDAYNIPDEQGRVLINIGHPEKEEDIFLAPQIARIIKPHQIGGVRFLFDNIIESVERFSSSTGFGCILAHSMGLGKTLQIVCFCDIFLRHTNSKTVLCIMPINTLQNWVAEFNMWLPLEGTNSPLAAHGEVRHRNFPIYVLNDSHKTLLMRAKVVKDWRSTGGVLMIGYELYRLLCLKKDKKPRKKKKADKDSEKDKNDDKKGEAGKEGNEDTQGSSDNTPHKLFEDTRQENGENSIKSEHDTKEDVKKEDEPTEEEKKLLDEMYDALVRPGPDLVICDEGHRIKNSHSNISYALKQMRTKRRIVLTGYPLQNNLLEYWCMVDFVRPNYLGSKTEFCNMFERPIQNGQCIDSTPQDIRLMRYRAHVLHSLLVGFVQRRSHAVLQSTLPQKEEYVLLLRLTPLQRKLYDRFMNEVVRSTSVPNPLKAFAICCKIWNHPDVLYNFLKKRSEVNAAIEEDLDLEEIGGTTKTGRSRNRAPPKRPAKPRVSTKKNSSKKPAATIPPNTSSGPPKVTPLESKPGYNTTYPPNGPPYGPEYRPDNSGNYPPYPGYQNTGQNFYPGQEGYNQNYGNQIYPQPGPYTNNYENQQYPQNEQNCNQNFDQNYWGNGNYYGNSGYYNNQSFPNNQTGQNFRPNPPADYNESRPYSQTFPTPNEQPYADNPPQPYQNNQEAYVNEPRQPYTQTPYQNPQSYPPYPPTQEPGQTFPDNQPPPNYPNQPYPPRYDDNTYPPYNPPYDHASSNTYPNYHNVPGQNNQSGNNIPKNGLETVSSVPPENPPNDPTNYPVNNIKLEPGKTSNDVPPSFPNNPYSYDNQQKPYSDEKGSVGSINYTNQFGTYPPPELVTKTPLGSSDDQLTSWPLTEAIKSTLECSLLEKTEEKLEVKSESDSEVKIEDLDTKKIINNDSKDIKKENVIAQNNVDDTYKQLANNNVCVKKISSDLNSMAATKEIKKKDMTDSEIEVSKKGKKAVKPRSNNKDKNKVEKETKRKSKPRSKLNAISRKGRKSSKEKCHNSDSDKDSDKEEKRDKEEEAALAKKAEEMTYDWVTELLKDYIPGLIENSAKMEIFFFILNESIKLGDRLLLFSQSLFTLNLIEDFLEKNYIPGTNCHWQRNTNYYRLDGSTHALEREKLINEFNANPNIYLFLVSTRAGSLGINLVGANRVIVFDASWNPCHDTQAVCRVYRYGQRKPCFVYRFVMDWCLEKKIYDRQINKQGMADRVVDECNPDAVLSMKEITNLCFDNDEKETEIKDLSEHKDKYIDIVMQQIISEYGSHLSKEPFQHESLLVDRKEKKLSSAEKRLAQRGYELEKKAAAAPKPTSAYRTVRTADGSIIQRPVASVRPMQHGARWIPADVWRRQGMTAQEMTLPLDVVIPTNSAEKSNIVLKAGQRVMVLKSPKGIYMQLESGKIIAIKTSFKMGQKGGEVKDNSVGKKIMGNRPVPANLPGSLKNNSAITVIPKGSPRPMMQRMIHRPSFGGPNRGPMSRPFPTGHKFADNRPRPFGPDHNRQFPLMRSKPPMQPNKLIRPNLPSCVSITKIPKEPRKWNDESVDMMRNKMAAEKNNDIQAIGSGDDDRQNEMNESKKKSNFSTLDNKAQDYTVPKESTSKSIHNENSKPPNEISAKLGLAHKKYVDIKREEPVSLIANERFPPEETLEERNIANYKSSLIDDQNIDRPEKISKTSLLKNYRHQRPMQRLQPESSLSQLEKTASSVHREGMPGFRKNLDDITQSRSPTSDDRPVTKSRKKKPTNIPEGIEIVRHPPQHTHSVSNLLGHTPHESVSKQINPSRTGGHDPAIQLGHNAPSSTLGHATQHIGSTTITHHPRFSGQNHIRGMDNDSPVTQTRPTQGHSNVPLGPVSHIGHHTVSSKSPALRDPAIFIEEAGSNVPAPHTSPLDPMSASGQPVYPAAKPVSPDNPYSQYPSYGVGYGPYTNPPYYEGYGPGYPNYPAYPQPSHPYSPPRSNSEQYPPNQQW